MSKEILREALETMALILERYEYDQGSIDVCALINTVLGFISGEVYEHELERHVDKLQKQWRLRG